MTSAVTAGLILLFLGLGLFLAGVRWSDRWAHGGGLMVALTGFFVLFTSLMWEADGSSPLLSALLIFGSAGIFRLMGSFETGPPKS